MAIPCVCHLSRLAQPFQPRLLLLLLVRLVLVRLVLVPRLVVVVLVLLLMPRLVVLVPRLDRSRSPTRPCHPPCT